MNVLILHQHFKTPHSGGAIRSYYLAKALVSQGHQVTIITSSNQDVYKEVTLEGINIHQLPIAYSNYFGFWKRVISFLRYNWWIVTHSSKYKHADLCYAVSVPLTIGLAAQWIQWRHKIPYLFEVGDLWPDVPIELDVIESEMLKKYLLRIEKSIYSSAKAVIALSPSIKSAIEKKLSDKPVYNIPNMADMDYYIPEVKDQRLEEKYKTKGKLVISYFGAMGFANGLDYLLDCAKVCQEKDLPVQFLMAGDGVERENLKIKSKNLGLQNLSFQDFKTRDGIKELMNVTDAIFVCYRNARILETGSPNKFFDGLAAGKLIIINFGGWIKTEIEDSKCGFSIDANQPSSILDPIKKIITYQLLTSYQKNARQLAEKFSREKLTREWLSILEQSVKTTRS